MTLTQLVSPINDPLSFFTICGGRVSGVQRFAWQDADAELLQEARAMLNELRAGTLQSQGTQPFAVRLGPLKGQDKSGSPVFHSFELLKDGHHQNFILYPPLPEGDSRSRLQEAGLYGGLCGASFNAEFKASLAEMSAEEHARYAPPLEQEEGLEITRSVLANRPAVTTALSLRAKQPHLRAQAIQLALHFTLALLENPYEFGAE